MRTPLLPLFVLLMTVATPPPATAAASGSMVGSYGFDETGMDRSVRPGDDFDRYANGAWSARTVIPGDHAYWGNWDILEEEARTQVRDILEEAGRVRGPAGSNPRRMGDYYASYMDEAAIERAGATPLKSELAAIASIRDYVALATEMGRALRDGDSMPLNVFVIGDLKRPDANLPYLEQGGLGLPDRDYYLKDEPAMVKAQKRAEEFTETMGGVDLDALIEALFADVATEGVPSSQEEANIRRARGDG